MTVSLVSIASRRYLGNKASLAPWIVESTVQALGRPPATVADLFAGTGSVAWAFNRSDTAVMANDLLYSNYLCLHAWLGVRRWRREQVERWLHAFNGLSPASDNYVSEQFGDRYWPMPVARHIGAVREAIDTVPATHDERTVLLAALLYAADRVANTCGHYDAWRRGSDAPRPLQLRLPDLSPELNAGNVVRCGPADGLLPDLDVDVAYLDPPYNSRQYSDTYHVLENLARWEKPPLFGVARKMDRSGLKSSYCTRQAAAAFASLVSRLRARLVVVSYNNMGTRGDSRSNACIPDGALLEALQRRGEVRVLERDCRAFNAGKRELPGHRERLFVCRT